MQLPRIIPSSSRPFALLCMGLLSPLSFSMPLAKAQDLGEPIAEEARIEASIEATQGEWDRKSCENLSRPWRAIRIPGPRLGWAICGARASPGVRRSWPRLCNPIHRIIFWCAQVIGAWAEGRADSSLPAEVLEELLPKFGEVLGMLPWLIWRRRTLCPWSWGCGIPIPAPPRVRSWALRN